MMLEFLLYPWLVGCAVAVVAGPLGSFVIWRRMAFFGETLAHSALMGVAMGVLWQLNLTVAVLVASLIVAALLALLQIRPPVALDTLLGLFSHTALSLGLIALHFIDDFRLDLMAFLFGDLLAVGQQDWWFTATLTLLVGAVLVAMWRPLLALAVHAELAQVEGVRVSLIRMLFMLLLAALVAMALKIVGLLLITSLLVIPAAAARALAHTPEQMALLASAIGVVSVTVGLAGSYSWDLPAGPAIVVCATTLFTLTNSLRVVQRFARG